MLPRAQSSRSTRAPTSPRFGIDLICIGISSKFASVVHVRVRACVRGRARACACVRAVCMDVPVPGIGTSGVRAGVRVRAVCVCMCASVDARNYRSGLPPGIILYTTWTRARVQYRARDCTTCARKCLLPTQCQPQSSPRFSARERRISVTRSPSPLFFSRPRQMAEATNLIGPQPV